MNVRLHLQRAQSVVDFPCWSGTARRKAPVSWRNCLLPSPIFSFCSSLPPHEENPAGSDKHIQCDCFALPCVRHVCIMHHVYRCVTPFWVRAKKEKKTKQTHPRSVTWMETCLVWTFAVTHCVRFQHPFPFHIILILFFSFSPSFLSPVEKCMSSMQMGTQMVKLRGGSKGLVRFFYLDEHKSCIRWRPSRKNEKAKSEFFFCFFFPFLQLLESSILNLQQPCGSFVVQTYKKP